MLPIISESIKDDLLAVMGDHAPVEAKAEWKKTMIHHLKDENPEVNALLLALAQTSSDPKTVVLAGYAIYKALELAQEEENLLFKED